MKFTKLFDVHFWKVLGGLTLLVFCRFFALQRLKTCSLPDLRMLFEAAAVTGHVESLGAQLVKDEKDAEEDGDEEDADSDDGDDDERDEVDAEEMVTMEDDGDDEEEEEEELKFERSDKNYAPPIHGFSRNRAGEGNYTGIWPH